MNMKKAKKAPKSANEQPNGVQNFDDFLETLDDSDSDDSDDSEADADGENDEEQESEEEISEDDDDDEKEHAEDDDEELLDIEEEPKLNGHGSQQKDDGSESEISDEDDADPEQTAAEHKKSLQKLQETDPDFFEFLKENDADLLNFENSDDDDSGSEDDDEEGALHKPPEELEEASDSEAEEERLDTKAEDYGTKVAKLIKQGIVNLNVIKDWETKLSTTRDLATFVSVIEAFQCAVSQILQDEDSGKLKWKVDGSAHFNALVRLCVNHVKGFCVRYLSASNNLAVSEKNFDQRPTDIKEKNAQKWNKLRSKLRIYMNTIVQFLKSMGNTDAVASILRHCRKMSGFWALLGPKSFKLLRTLINTWSQGEDSCRILAYLTIGKMTEYNPEVYLTRIHKQMYLAYVTNCKFTSANSWPAINFMRTCLSELYNMDTSSAYPVAFAFIRQLAIHLKNALTAGTTQIQGQAKLSKKEASRIVYSWQFVHSIHVWVDLLCDSRALRDENLKLLVYPIVQICMGTIKLIPTKKYIPLRFLIIRMLIQLQEKADVFIPTLPLITQVLMMTDFSMKSVSKFSTRPLDMTCCLKADATESGYGKSISENTFELILRACKAVATDLAFPEIVTPTLMQLRSFLKKKCKNPEVSRKFKTLVEKIEANSKYISDKRSKAMEAGSVSLSDMESQKILKIQMETSKPHPPLVEFATEYLKVHEKAHAKYRKINLETREEKLIPRHSAAFNQKRRQQSSKQILDSDEDDSDSEQFKTKLDEEDEIPEEVPPTPEEDDANNKKSNKKLKRKLAKNSDDASAVLKKKKKKSKKPAVPEADDELVDLEFSD